MQFLKTIRLQIGMFFVSTVLVVHDCIHDNIVQYSKFPCGRVSVKLFKLLEIKLKLSMNLKYSYTAISCSSSFLVSIYTPKFNAMSFFIVCWNHLNPNVLRGSV